METIVKLNNQTLGRDKLARLIQYLSRVVWHYMEQRNANKKSVEKLKQIEYTFSTFRKILRLGRCIDVLYSSLTTINYTEPMVRLTSTLSKITNGLYLLCDHVLWAARAGLADINTAEWGTTANRYWLFSIYCNLIRDVYEIFRIISLYNNKVYSLFLNNEEIHVNIDPEMLCFLMKDLTQILAVKVKCYTKLDGEKLLRKLVFYCNIA
ncbi:peroxisomal biogenesis factor 11ab isoform X3 [Lycorma delicatula]|uniref:peroxisomal biogenesis factor 11ab isoform X3 n=1 Tax=Lycorma delicatula TaxID=130591 RepID=UPI003F5196AC